MKRHMPGRYSLAGLAACGVLLATAAHGAKALSVEEDLISVSPPDANGDVTVTAAPRAVVLLQPAAATFTIENGNLKPKPHSTQGVVERDGSFRAKLPGAPGHKLKITISITSGAAAGKSKGFKKKVPAGPLPPLRSTQTDRRSLFSQSPAAKAGAPPKGAARRWTTPAEPTPEITINYRTGPSKPSSSPYDPDAEVRQSGVLPPD